MKVKLAGMVLLLCFCLFLAGCREESVPVSDEFIQFIQPFYEGEQEAYAFLDAENEGQSEKIYRVTVEWAQAGQWDKVHRYVFEQAQVVQYDRPPTEDSGKREQVVTVATQVRDEEDPEEIREVYWDIYGTIWYDDNGTISEFEGRNYNLNVIPRDGTVYQMATNICDADLKPDQKSVTFYSAVQLAAQSLESTDYTEMYERVDCEITVTAPAEQTQ